MAYGSAKGRIFRGDIYAEDDTNKDTFIDWGNDYISFAVGGTKVLNVSSSGAIVQVLGTVSASVNVSASAFYGDFYGDSFINTSGHLTIQNTAANKRIINKLASNDSTTSFQIRNSDNTASFAVDGAGTVVVTPTGILQISSAGVLSSSANLSASAFYGDGANLTNLPGGGGIFTELGATTAATTSSVKIGTGSAPMITLDVHLTGSGDPINLSNDTGGGEVVYFGTGSGALTAGGVYYLNSDGGWQSVDSSVTGSGHNQLLGIALGAKANTHGVLVRGYFDVNAYYSGSFVKGGPMYIQSSSVGRTATGGGYLSGAAPSAGDSYVRVVGYGTDTANVIYFNPDSTYVELV